ncbi:MAG: M20/M25/M40 family metallo-hydrolase [Planctomycetota bacterium]|nr:M20/M25/M40 family metallo-hydrolase [Planctomycetota bacterium]
MNKNAEMLKRLTTPGGVSGFESPAAQAAAREFKPLADTVQHDRNGSVVATKFATSRKRGKKAPLLLIDAHVDEIGLIVTRIEDDGMLRIAQIGGFDQRVLPSQEVIVHARRPLRGIIGSKPVHLLTPEERAAVDKLEDLYVDVGLPASSVRRLVQVGDYMSMAPWFHELRNGFYAGKAMDDRTGVAAQILMLEALKGRQHTWDVACVAATQEEYGGYGASTCAFRLAPDAAIALDVTQGQAPGLSEDETFPMGKGPCIAVGPNIHPGIYDRLCKAAKAEELPYSIEPVPGVTGTDAGPIQVTRHGVPTGLVSIPLRYMHTSVETVAMLDIERTGRLLARFVVDMEGPEKLRE